MTTQGYQVRSPEGSLGRSNGSERQGKILMVQGGHQVRSFDESLGRSNGPKRDSVFLRDLLEQWREVGSCPTQTVGSWETIPEQCKQIDT